VTKLLKSIKGIKKSPMSSWLFLGLPGNPRDWLQRNPLQVLDPVSVPAECSTGAVPEVLGLL
jgi:hypothetical protein